MRRSDWSSCFVFQYPSNPLDLMKYCYHLSHYVVDCVGWLWQLDTCFRLQLKANEHASIIHRTSNTCIVATDDANLRSLAFSLMTPIRGLFVFAFQSPSNQQKHLPKVWSCNWNKTIVQSSYIFLYWRHVIAIDPTPWSSSVAVATLLLDLDMKPSNQNVALVSGIVDIFVKALSINDCILLLLLFSSVISSCCSVCCCCCCSVCCCCSSKERTSLR